MHEQAVFEKAFSNFVSRQHEGNMNDLWRHDDTNSGYYFGMNNIEKAAFIKNTLEAVMKELLPTFRILYIIDKEEIRECFEQYFWKEE
jgi:hypothetical protein